MSFARLFRVLSREPACPGSILGRPDAPGLDFGSRNAWFFELFRCPRTFGANFVRSVQNTGRSYVFRISELLRDEPETLKNRSAIVFDNVRRSKHARTLLRNGPGASWDRLGNTFGRFPGSLGMPWASKNRSGGAFDRPGRVPSGSRRGDETALNAQNSPRKDFR